MKALGAKLAGALGLLAVLSSPTAQAALPGQGFLPDNRAWEMVSPAAKNGGNVIPSSTFTRAAADGSAVGFASLALFGDAIGAGIHTDYVAKRSTNPDPGGNGWSTHAITPQQDPNTKATVFSGLDPRYIGEFTSDLSRGVFFAKSPLTADSYVSEVLNLYRRTDLLTPGTGTYELVSACPHCAKTGKPLPPLPGVLEETKSLALRPSLVGASPDLERLIFESQQRLTTDTPEPFTGHERLYEWEGGAVRLAGRIPSGTAIECDDVGGPACIAARVSIGGHGTNSYSFLTPHTVSDGSDGHSHVFFTAPTDAGGAPVAEGLVGNVYVRSDASATAKLNASERDEEPGDAFARAAYFDATPDGRLVFFTTNQALTDDAPADGQSKLYSYDTTKPASAPDNLTLLSPDGEPADDGSGGVLGVIGASEDGAYAYFAAAGQLVAGEPPLGGNHGIYLWHAGDLRFIGRISSQGVGDSTSGELLSTGTNFSLNPHQARVTPDGARLLFSSVLGKGLLSRYGGTDHDHGACSSKLGKGCRELYLYSADDDELVCASCKPDGGASATVPAEGMSSTFVHTLSGGSSQSTHMSRALSEDGRYVFFSTAQKLVAEDTNGILDAYAYNASSEEPRLLSSGEDSARSWFVDASPDGSDAVIVTREQLSGWDVGLDYDLYDARVGGGFPEPPPPPPGCIGDACQPAPAALENPNLASVGFQGPGNRIQRKPPVRCRKGQRKVKRRGKTRCVRKGRAHR